MAARIGAAMRDRRRGRVPVPDVLGGTGSDRTGAGCFRSQRWGWLVGRVRAGRTAAEQDRTPPPGLVHAGQRRHLALRADAPGPAPALNRRGGRLCARGAPTTSCWQSPPKPDSALALAPRSAPHLRRPPGATEPAWSSVAEL
jgi:hypothetical protein